MQRNLIEICLLPVPWWYNFFLRFLLPFRILLNYPIGNYISLSFPQLDTIINDNPDAIWIYGEEGELQFRMAKAGYKRMLLSAPKIIHLEGKSLEQSDEKRKIMLRSHFYVLKKYMNYPTYLLARMYHYIRK